MDELAQQIAAGGTFGLILALVVALVVGFRAYNNGTIRSGKLVDAELVRRDLLELRLVGERDAAIALAQSYAEQFERALDIIEGRTPKP